MPPDVTCRGGIFSALRTASAWVILLHVTAGPHVGMHKKAGGGTSLYHLRHADYPKS